MAKIITERTRHFRMPLLAEAQLQMAIPNDEALFAFDAQVYLNVSADNVDNPGTATWETSGYMYLVNGSVDGGSSAFDEWRLQEGKIAVYSTQAFIPKLIAFTGFWALVTHWFFINPYAGLYMATSGYEGDKMAGTANSNRIWNGTVWKEFTLTNLGESPSLGAPITHSPTANSLREKQTYLLGLPFTYSDINERVPETNFNQALDWMTNLIHIAVESIETTTPPGSPTEGDRYLIPTSSTGAWSTHIGELVTWMNAAWAFYIPQCGQRFYVKTGAKAGAWIVLGDLDYRRITLL